MRLRGSTPAPVAGDCLSNVGPSWSPEVCQPCLSGMNSKDFSPHFTGMKAEAPRG